MITAAQSVTFRKHFPEDLVVTPLGDANYWRIDQAFKYISARQNGGMLITVDVAFATDFASVPVPFRWWIPKWGKYGWAAVVHDWLYAEQMYCKEFADDIFHEAMLISGVNPFMSKVMYLAVSWFGLPAWLSAEAKLKLGKRKRAEQGIASHPNWALPLRQQLAGIGPGWQQRRKLWKSRKQ